MFKRKYMFFFLLFLMILFSSITIINYLLGERLELLLNWNLYFAKPIEIEKKYKYTYSEGDDFYIWSYNSKMYQKIVSKKLLKIEKSNIDFVNEKILNYHNRLDNREIKILETSINLEDLITIDNHYLFLEKDNGDDFLIIIANSDNNKLYIFNSVR